MSLIVAAATETGPTIVSDTRVGPAHGVTPSYRTDTLKTVVLSPGLCVCFAGEVELGLRAVRQAARTISSSGSADSVVHLLERLLMASPRDVEFLVARSGGDWQLARITRGGVEVSLTNAWIGDRAAFERFQQARQDYEEPSYGATASEAIRIGLLLSHCMHTVIEDPAIPSVGDFLIRVACLPDGFNYLDSFFTVNGRNFEITVPSGRSVPIPWSTSVADGSYTISIVAPASPGVPALALLFPFAGFSLIFMPLEHDEAQVVRHSHPSEFVDRVHSELGVLMHEPVHQGNDYVASRIGQV